MCQNNGMVYPGKRTQHTKPTTTVRPIFLLPARLAKAGLKANIQK